MYTIHLRRRLANENKTRWPGLHLSQYLMLKIVEAQ
jgi:hypothetical protein